MTKFEIEIDETAKGVKLFEKADSISISKAELFKYAIMMWEVPNHIVESDFDYLQSKIPGLELLISDFIEFDSLSVKNLSNDDRIKKLISEAIGVGIGLKYTVEILDTNPNKFKKIAPLTDGKYLDYSTIKDNREYEIETKGTVNKYYSTFKKDILSKKANKLSKSVYLRYGTIAMICDSKTHRNAKCVIVDDPPENNFAEEDNVFKTQLLAYASFLGYIVDSKNYNKFIKPLKKEKFGKIKINENKFFGKYILNGVEYYGEFFDHRLIREQIDKVVRENIEAKEFFKRLTQNLGKNKIFIGLDEKVIEAINTSDSEFLNKYESEKLTRENERKSVFLDKDGILIVKSKSGSDRQIEKIMTEEEVARRLGLYVNYLRGNPHKCGAPCTSRYLEGKPCEIRTYRGNCHFHR
ncbi:hypothetical protein [Leeuwenhoekiella sp.]|uniref:hypothetical protein n=1 Tax=Leeuwenhoekiella sp. TaxID=1977054 RepID=UPI0025C162BD|nr:hypothetical protein [Leeuwenhoekiella sp.]|tara:strand:+ start:6361 stop:7590 length:1230 start_codon:yes stop_codon:yes gene_type:complete